MNDIVRELNNVIEKYKDKTFHTGELNFVEMAKSCKIVIQDLLQEKADRENPKPLTLEELKERDGKPVRIEENGESEYGLICLSGNCFTKEGVITLRNGNFYLLSDVNHCKVYPPYDHEPKEATDDR